MVKNGIDTVSKEHYMVKNTQNIHILYVVEIP